MSYDNITRLSIGQGNSTVKLDIGPGQHKLLPGNDFASMICLKEGQPVVPQYFDKWNPENYGYQEATVVAEGKTYRGFMVNPLSSYAKPTLAQVTNTAVFNKWSVIDYHTPTQPARIAVPEGETLTVCYNTNTVRGYPVYKAYVNQGKLVRIEMMLMIENKTGLALKFAPNSQLIFKVTDPNAAPNSDADDGVRYEAVAASMSLSNAAGEVVAVKANEMMTFTLQATEIPVGNSTRVVQILKESDILAEKHLWYYLLNNAMIWGYRVQFRTALPRGQLYVFDQATYDSISMSKAEFPMIVAGKPTRLRIAPTNDRVRPVKMSKIDEGKTTVYELPKDSDTDLKTVYLLKQENAQGKITPNVPVVDCHYEFTGDSHVLINDKKLEK